MIVKTKKRHKGRVIRVQGEGEVKEVLINENLTDVDKRVISICFRGRESSGIVDLSEKEAEDLSKTLGSLAKLIKSTKILKSVKM
jgi:hypothetical protein